MTSQHHTQRPVVTIPSQLTFTSKAFLLILSQSAPALDSRDSWLEQRYGWTQGWGGWWGKPHPLAWVFTLRVITSVSKNNSALENSQDFVQLPHLTFLQILREWSDKPSRSLQQAHKMVTETVDARHLIESRSRNKNTHELQKTIRKKEKARRARL